jgi:hypothetical protein
MYFVSGLANFVLKRLSHSQAYPHFTSNGREGKEVCGQSTHFTSNGGKGKPCDRHKRDHHPALHAGESRCMYSGCPFRAHRTLNRAALQRLLCEKSTPLTCIGNSLTECPGGTVYNPSHLLLSFSILTSRFNHHNLLFPCHPQKGHPNASLHAHRSCNPSCSITPFHRQHGI